jgi:hypothetical protein
MKRSLKPIAMALLTIILFTLLGMAIPYAIGYLLIPSRGIVLDPISGSREEWAYIIGRCLMVPGATLGFLVGLVMVLLKRGKIAGKSAPDEEEKGA